MSVYQNTKAEAFNYHLETLDKSILQAEACDYR